MEPRGTRAPNTFEYEAACFNPRGTRRPWFVLRPVTLNPGKPGDGEDIGDRVERETAFGVRAVEDDKRFLWHCSGSQEEQEDDACGDETEEACV